MIDVVIKVKELNLASGSYIVIASGILGALGIRAPHDIDLWVKPEVYAHYKNLGWQEIRKPGKPTVIARDSYEMGQGFGDRSLKQALKTATLIDGVAFESLETVLAWKRSMNRPKDQSDIALIEAYLKKHRPRR